MNAVLVFDSGVGGLSVVEAIAAAGLPVRLEYLADSAWLPYGEKDPAALRARLPMLLAQALRASPADLVVVACNTASTLALEQVRAALPVPVVGVVPPVKPAAERSRSRAIGVLATAATIASPYLEDLIARFAADCAVVRVAAPELVALAERKLSGAPIDVAAVQQATAPLFQGLIGARLDVVALACTHFPLLRAELAAAAPRAVTWLDSGGAIARRMAALLNLAPGSGVVQLAGARATAHSDALAAAAARFGFKDVEVWPAAATAPT